MIGKPINKVSGWKGKLREIFCFSFFSLFVELELQLWVLGVPSRSKSYFGNGTPKLVLSPLSVFIINSLVFDSLTNHGLKGAQGAPHRMVPRNHFKAYVLWFEWGLHFFLRGVCFEVFFSWKFEMAPLINIRGREGSIWNI